jgi:uncharacterized protein
MEETTVLTEVDRRAAPNRATWFGLFLSLFSMIVIRQACRAVSTEPGTTLALMREAAMFASAGLLLWLIRRKEKLPLRSVGIGTSPVWKSLAWGLVIAVACAVPAAVIAKFTGYGHGSGSQSFAKLPVWLIFIVVVRAGIVEELFFRGYPIDRLKWLGFGRTVSWVIPLLIFGVAHWTGGVANIAIALTLGGILTAFYLWRKDLVANMFGHFLVDFVSNVLPAIFG